MENLAPPHRLLLTVRYGLENGEGLRSILQAFLLDEDGRFSDQVREFIYRYDNHQGLIPFIQSQPTAHRKVLFETIAMGLDGQSILPQIRELEVEFLTSCEEQIDRKLAELPVLMLVPLLIFQFPAFLILLIGPLLQRLLGGMQ